MEESCDHRGVVEKGRAANDEKFKQIFEKLDKIIAILDKK